MRVNASKVANFAVFFSVGIIAALFMRLSQTTWSDLALQRQRIYYEDLFASWFSQRGFNLTVVHEAEIIHRNVQLLCVVLLKQDTDYVDALYVPDGYVPVTTIAEQAIMDTWGKRCRQLVFYSTGVPRVTLATGVQWVLLNDSIPGAEGQWRSCREALTHVAINYLHAYDWFFLAEEDTFVIIENLEYFLVAHDRTQLKYLGHAISKWNVDHNVIGAGVAINRNTLKKLHSELLKGHCAANDLSSDPALAQCLYGLGIYPEDTRDMLNRARFMLYPSQLLLVPASMVWRYRLWSNSKYSSSEIEAMLVENPSNIHTVVTLHN